MCVHVVQDERRSNEKNAICWKPQIRDPHWYLGAACLVPQPERCRATRQTAEAARMSSRCNCRLPGIDEKIGQLANELVVNFTVAEIVARLQPTHCQQLCGFRGGRPPDQIQVRIVHAVSLLAPAAKALPPWNVDADRAAVNSPQGPAQIVRLTGHLDHAPPLDAPKPNVQVLVLPRRAETSVGPSSCQGHPRRSQVASSCRRRPYRQEDKPRTPCHSSERSNAMARCRVAPAGIRVRVPCRMPPWLRSWRT